MTRSTLCVKLPFVVAPRVDEPAAALETSSGSTHVLIVAREEAILQLIAYIFHRAAIESIGTSSLASALRAFRAQTPAIVVVDSYGLTLTREFLDTVGSPLLVLTPDEPEKILMPLALRHRQYLQKPFSGEELVARVRAHLGQP